MNNANYKNPSAYECRTVYTYSYPEILFEPANSNESMNESNTNNRTQFTEKNLNCNEDNYNFGDIISIESDRLSVLGISINIDDLIILVILFFMFQNGNVDYTLAIVLGLLLFSQD